MLPGNELKYYTGKQAALFADALWNALDAQRQRVMLWAVAPESKYAAFAADITKADVVGVAYQKGKIFAFAWVGPVMPGSRTGHAHFAFIKDVDDTVSQEFWADVKQLGLYDSILAIQPLAYKAARAHAIKHGFVVLGNVPGLLRVYGRDKPCTGVMLVKDMR